MADYRRTHDEGSREPRAWFEDEARRRRGVDERDERYPYGSDRYARYEPSRSSGYGDYRDDRGSRWEGAAEDRYAYGGATGSYRTDDRAYHDRYREHLDRERGDRFDRDDRPDTDRNAAADYYRAAREQRNDYLRWSAQHNGTWGEQSFGDRDEHQARGPRERGGYWRQYERPEFAGRGPKDYQRSDDRIREEICDRMTDDSRLDASEISVEVARGDVTLTGSVTSRDQKRRAEDIAEHISGVRDVTNQLRVMRTGAGHNAFGDADRITGRNTTSAQPASEGGNETPSKSTSRTTT